LAEALQSARRLQAAFEDGSVTIYEVETGVHLDLLQAEFIVAD
jgi:hypothetical protein